MISKLKCINFNKFPKKSCKENTCYFNGNNNNNKKFRDKKLCIFMLWDCHSLNVTKRYHFKTSHTHISFALYYKVTNLYCAFKMKSHMFINNLYFMLAVLIKYLFYLKYSRFICYITLYVLSCSYYTYFHAFHWKMKWKMRWKIKRKWKKPVSVWEQFFIC